MGFDTVVCDCGKLLNFVVTYGKYFSENLILIFIILLLQTRLFFTQIHDISS